MMIAAIDYTVPVLIVEDDILIAWSVEAVAHDMGFKNVIVASTLESALEAVRFTKIGLIICDLNLGPLTADGVQLLNFIDHDEAIPTLIYTAYSGPELDTALSSTRPKALHLLKTASDPQIAAMIRVVLGSAERMGIGLNGTDRALRRAAK